MYDVLDTKHVGCGGTFREINIWEDIACDKCGLGSERYILTPTEQASADRAREKIELEAQIRTEGIQADQIGTVYVLMKIIPYEGECLQGVYVSDEQARRAAGGKPEDFYGPCQSFRIHAVKVGAETQGYF